MQSAKKLKILMLEDNPDDAGLVERILKKDNMAFVTERVDTREEFNNSIKNFCPDVILSDHGLPHFNSIEALKISIKERAFAPFILVTGTVSEEFAATCLNLGADDYILKSNLLRLPSAIRRALKERKLNYLKQEARRALRKQNKALLDSNTELMKVNSELDRFVYSVSHNLRAPLTSVMGLLNLVRQEDPDKKLSAFHEMMDVSIKRLDETLREIIDYSRNARNEVDVEVINVEELLHSVVEKLSYLEREKTIQWNIEIQPECLITSDRSRLEIILKSILANSIMYRDTGRTSIITVTGAISAQTLSILIKDNGTGISESTLPRVFDMFFRGTTLSNGAGLGLYIAREAVRKLKGSIEIASKENEGTSVSVTLPNMLLP